MQEEFEQDIHTLSEEDFYPPSDNRTLKSNVFDISGGDSFEEYTKYFFEVTDEWETYD